MHKGNVLKNPSAVQGHSGQCQYWRTPASIPGNAGAFSDFSRRDKITKGNLFFWANRRKFPENKKRFRSTSQDKKNGGLFFYRHPPF